MAAGTEMHYLPNPIQFPYNAPVTTPRAGAAATFGRFTESLQRTFSIDSYPVAVAIGPYNSGYDRLSEMEQVKRAALEEFRRRSSAPSQDDQGEPAVVQAKVLSLVGPARSCYAGDQVVESMSDDEFADMMFLDGWFLLQFMVSMCPDNPDAPPEDDLLMKRAEVHTRINDIARDVLLLENQIPWFVLEALMELWPAATVPVDRFLCLMSSAFHVGNEDDVTDDDGPTAAGPLLEQARINEDGADDQLPAAPPHLLGLFYRRQVCAASAVSLRVPRLSSMSRTAVELAEMGVKVTACSKTNSKFGNMSMVKRRPCVYLFGELALAPLVLNDLTRCWLVNMAAYEARLGATRANNFAIGSYISVAAMLMNREEDVQELRAKGVVDSAFTDKLTLDFFKDLSPSLHVGARYFDVFQSLQEYKQERWLWIAVHRFFYKNIKTILAVLSVAGVLAGLFKAILSLKQPQRY